MLFNPENKSSNALEEKVSTRDIDITKEISGVSFPEFLFTGGNGDLSAFAAIKLYEQVMPFYNAVDLRATALSEIPIRLYDKQEKRFVDEHPILDLLEAPNAMQSQGDFIYELSSFLDITGESYLLATGRTNRPPLELIGLNPTSILTGKMSSQFGLLGVPSDMTAYLESGIGSVFKAQEVDNKIRFYSRDDTKELWQIASFNPRKGKNSFRGMSKAKPCWLEMQQYLSGNRTNLSTLKRGTRLSMAWVNAGKEELTNVQWERMQQEAAKYTGDTNAGGTPILDGMDVKTIQQTNKDMEFGKLQDTMVARIANVWSIPLALLLDTVMTLNNLETSVLHLYDMSVLPHARRVFKSMERFLLPRYPDGNRYSFTYNESDIPAVRARLIDTAKKQKEVGVNTVNELRSVIGEENHPEGNQILVQRTQVPLSLIGAINKNLTGNNASEKLIQKDAAYEKFLNEMRSVKTTEGERVYSDDYINRLALEKGLIDAN